MKILDTGLSAVPGFQFAAIECGIRYPNRLDLALIYSEKECNAAGMFTTNKVFAAPVKLCRERINSKISGIVINATNANACTGIEGFKNAVNITAEIAKLLNKPADSFLMGSTGIIGHQLPADKIISRLPDLKSSLSSSNGKTLSKAIMTTDTVPKDCAVEISTTLGNFKIAGTAKGSGMIAPNMGTLLAFIITDAPLSKSLLNKIFRQEIKGSLNAITIDGDTSTNDTALILSPAEGKSLSSKNDIAAFTEGLRYILGDLAKKLVKDGEGATKCAEVKVTSAKNSEDAQKAVRSIAESLLVKTALFGKDPNWGRVACAAGYSGAEFKQDKLTISFNDVLVLKNGMPTNYNKEALVSILENSEFTINVDLGAGKHGASMLTSDISFDYVKINAEYST